MRSVHPAVDATIIVQPKNHHPAATTSTTTSYRIMDLLVLLCSSAGAVVHNNSISKAGLVTCLAILAWKILTKRRRKKYWQETCRSSRPNEKTKFPIAAAAAERPDSAHHQREPARRRLRKRRILQRKDAFLTSLHGGERSGYGGCGSNNVDDFDRWREREFPALIRPVVGKDDTALEDDDDDDDDQQQQHRMVYLDYAGAALPTQSQLSHIYQQQTTNNMMMILANPHSMGPAASYTKTLHESVKTTILDHFNAHAQHYYLYFGAAAATSTTTTTNDDKDDNDDGNNNNDDGVDHRSNDSGGDGSMNGRRTSRFRSGGGGGGYELVFTSGTTEAMRIVAERFPWRNNNNNKDDDRICPECGGQQGGPPSHLAYAKQSHTSVIGMRGAAWAAVGDGGGGGDGLIITCKPMAELLRDFEQGAAWCRPRGTGGSDCRCCRHPAAAKLLVLPLECNFTGDRWATPVVRTILARASQWGWSTFLDVAKAAATSPVDLSVLNPDFAAVSFYKLFGEPTGLGALLVKRSSIHMLDNPHTGGGNDECAPPSIYRYFGGGSVDVVVPGSDFAVPRREPTALASMHHGTVHFRGIAALRHGFAEIERYGGMHKVHGHTSCLARELARRLQALRHGNGQRAVIVYGNWANAPTSELSTCGSIVSFNVVRSNGQPVGYNEVSKLATLNTPPIQLRTGCFCNPGACQEALGISDAEIVRNYIEAGQVCGDSLDVINGKPTGAVRASFGKDSIWEDLDVLVEFLQQMFVDHGRSSSSSSVVANPLPTRAVISELFLFPIKSCAAQKVQEWPMDQRTGRFLFDREFALVDSSGTAMRLQSYQCMTQVRPRVNLDTRIMTVSAPGQADLSIDLTHDLAVIQSPHDIKVCGNRCGAVLWDDGIVSEWFSSFIGVKCWLVRFSDEHAMTMPTSIIGKRPNNVAFANERPLLLLSERSIQTLNIVLQSQDRKPVSCMQFRPNIVVRSTSEVSASGIEENPEDFWTRVQVTDAGAKCAVLLEVVDKCARCAMVDFDPATGEKGNVFQTLAKFRRSKGRITFGVFLQCKDNDEGVVAGSSMHTLREGDVLSCT